MHNVSARERERERERERIALSVLCSVYTKEDRFIEENELARTQREGPLSREYSREYSRERALYAK